VAPRIFFELFRQLSAGFSSIWKSSRHAANRVALGC
jgi:hypothetical protein